MNPVISFIVARLGRLQARDRHPLPSPAPAERGKRGGGNMGCLLALVATVAFGLASCREGKIVEAPDLRPIGDGLQTIAYAVVGAAVVLTLSRASRP